MENIFILARDYFKNDEKLHVKFLKTMALRGATSGNEEIITSKHDRDIFTPTPC